MRTRTIILVACGALALTMSASQVLAVQLTLQGSQEAGSILSGPRIVAPPLNLTTSAQIVSVRCDTDHFTVHRNGAPYFTIEQGQDVLGVLPPGEYVLKSDIGRASIILETELVPATILLWGRQTAIVHPRWMGNVVVLANPTPIVDFFYDGTDGVGIFDTNAPSSAVLRYVSPHNISNPGPMVIDAAGVTVGESLVGLTLGPGAYTLTPGRGTADGVVQATVELRVGAGAAPADGWQAVATGGNTVDIGEETICIQSMENGRGMATQRRFYDFEEDYTVEFDFKLNEKNNHWFILFSDTFIHLHIDWGTDLFFYGPTNSKITGLDVGRWYHIRIQASPSRGSYDIEIDGQKVASPTNVTPGTIDVGQELGTSGIDGPEGAWIYIGDDQDTGYDRGVACWSNLVISAEASQPSAPISDHHVPD